MINREVFWNILLVLLCYGYVVLTVFASGKLPTVLQISQKTSRKFLHAMIGNLVFVIPFFTSSTYPALVAAPFILTTFLASPYSPLKGSRFGGLADISEGGHPLGLVLYAISYTLLAFFFASKPYIIAAGILPMAYGDSIGSLVGERYGKKVYHLVARKSLEGSIAMLCGSLLSLAFGMMFFSRFYTLQASNVIMGVLSVGGITTVAEGISPMGIDNVTVPLLGAVTFLLALKGI
jgi:dolichol kinase